MKKKLTSVNKVVIDLMEALTMQCKQSIKNCEDEDLAHYHHSLGRVIRNDFGLWKNNNPLLKDCLRIHKTRYSQDYKTAKDYYERNQIKIKIIHPDDASMVIIRELKRKLQKC